MPTRTVRGRIVPGLRAASGRSRGSLPGTIALQLPHFRVSLPGFDRFFDGPVHRGTLNVAISGRAVEVGDPPIHLTDVAWEIVENFYLAPCVLGFRGDDYRGLIYIPDPATKPDGLPTGHVIEVLTSRIPFIRYGSRVELTFERGAIALPRIASPS